MSFHHDNYIFGMAQWGFEQSRPKIQGMKIGVSNVAAYAIVEQDDSRQKYAYCLSGKPQHASMSSAAIAFIMKCKKDNIKNSFALITTDEGESWFCAYVDGMLLPSSEGVIEDASDLDYKVGNFIDSVDEGESISAYVSSAHHKFSSVKNLSGADTVTVVEYDLDGFCVFVDEFKVASQLLKLKESLVSPKAIALVGVIVVSVLVVVFSMSGEKAKKIETTASWSTKTVQGGPSKRELVIQSKQALETLVDQELVWLKEKMILSTSSKQLLNELVDNFSYLDSHTAGWDAKVMNFDYGSESVLVNGNAKFDFLYQRTPVGTIDSFKNANSDYHVSIDERGNLATVHLKVAQPQTVTQFDSDILAHFDSLGGDLHSTVSYVQSFCHTWNLNINCSVSKFYSPKRRVKADYSFLNLPKKPDGKNMLLQYNSVDITLTGKTLNALKQLTEILAFRDNLIIKNVQYDLSGHTWVVILVGNSEIKRNIATAVLEKLNV